MATGLNIVIVEDHDLAREELVLMLQSQGWSADGADCGEELNTLLKHQVYHVALLDVNLPYEDGLSIAKRLRVSHPAMWIIMLTARTRVADRKEGYQCGADIFISKPVNPDELIAVINNCAKRMGLQNAQVTQTRLNTSKRTLTLASGVAIRLTVSETLLLQSLAMMPERKAQTDYLIEMVFNASETIGKENLAVLVSRLRGKIQESEFGDDITLVSALRGYGYRLDMPIILE